VKDSPAAGGRARSRSHIVVRYRTREAHAMNWQFQQVEILSALRQADMLRNAGHERLVRLARAHRASTAPPTSAQSPQLAVHHGRRDSRAFGAPGELSRTR
jgi:hypothetical protein